MPVRLSILISCCLVFTSNACRQQKAGPQSGVAAPLPGALASPQAVAKDFAPAAANAQDEESKPEQASDTSGPCALLKDAEIQSVQGSPLKTRHPSLISKQGYRTAQCLYQTENINRSISLSVTEADPDDPQKYSVKALWKKMFDRKSNGEKERDKDRDKDREKKDATQPRPPGAGEEEEEETGEEAAPPRKVKGLGSEAYWVAAKFGGALYVLKGEKFIRISVGGRDDLPTKLRSSTTLARLALSRFS